MAHSPSIPADLLALNVPSAPFLRIVTMDVDSCCVMGMVGYEVRQPIDVP